MGRHVVDGREWPQPKKIGASRRPDLPPRGENYPHKPAMTSNSVKSQMRGVDMAAEWPGEPGHRGFLSMADVAGVATVKRCQIQTHDGHSTTPHCGAGEWHTHHPTPGRGRLPPPPPKSPGPASPPVPPPPPFKSLFFFLFFFLLPAFVVHSPPLPQPFFPNSPRLLTGPHVHGFFRWLEVRRR